MRKPVSEFVSEFSHWNLFSQQLGPDNIITGMPDVKESGSGDLVFVESEKYVELALKRKPSAIVTTENIFEKFSSETDTSVLVSGNAKLVQALFRQKYTDRDLRDNGWPCIHESAIIHESVNFSENVSVGPGVVISKNVSIGENSIILANTVIEEDVTIGNDTVIHPNVTIGFATVIGDRCVIQSGTVIGMEGYGYAQDDKQKSYRVPQLGNVLLGDDVTIGANCTIDRATFASTIINDGCKLDNLVHIAHNVEVGEDSLITALCVIAGSTKIGKRMRCSGQTGIIDHLTICDDVTLVQRAGVSADIKESGIYAGHPIQPLKKWFKNVAVAKQLEELKKTISDLEKRI